MKTLFITLFLAFSALGLPAQRNHLKPTDFEPLTRLPWEDVFSTPESVLKAIFKEPNPGIRYPVLGEYLRLIPADQLGKAFDLCVKLEGRQRPDELAAFFLQIWVKRDPHAGWSRVRELLKLVGPDGWLGFDSWETPMADYKINSEAIAEARFWLSPGALAGFPHWLEESALPKAERVKIMLEFAQQWLPAFASWPKSGGRAQAYFQWEEFTPPMAASFHAKPQYRFLTSQDRSALGDARFELELRRWMKEEPASTLKIITMAREAGASLTDLLLLWANSDLPALIRWAETLDPRKEEWAIPVKGFVMAKVDAATREHWLAEAKSARPEDDYTMPLMIKWASWDPKAALEVAAALQNAELFDPVAVDAAYGPGGGQPWNTSHHGFEVIKNFDLGAIRKDILMEATRNWYMIMEQWGDLDVGEAARYGLDYLLRTGYAPRENLLRFFSGDEKYNFGEGVVARTFCGLRVWAVTNPKEMEEWIATLKEEDMQKALTWLLENPWGEPKK